jgi:hypothetical protein
MVNTATVGSAGKASTTAIATARAAAVGMAGTTATTATAENVAVDAAHRSRAWASGGASRRERSESPTWRSTSASCRQKPGQ